MLIDGIEGVRMNDKKDDVGRKDTTEYSGSKAPETRREAEEDTEFSDPRLQPGGPRGSRADVGMSGMDRDVAVSGGDSTGQERYGEGSEE